MPGDGWCLYFEAPCDFPPHSSSFILNIARMPQRPGHNNYTTESYISHLWNGPLRHDIAQIENAKNAFAMEDLLQICNIRGKMFSRTNLFSEFLFVYKIKEVLLPTCLFLLVNVNCYFCQGEKRHLEILILTEVRYLDLWLWLSL